jgi:hypothetical protein
MVYNPSNVKKHDGHAVGRAAALPRLLRSWGSWALPLFSLGDHTCRPNSRPQ